MSDLRWVLLALGALVIALIWAMGSGRLKLPAVYSRRKPADRARTEPVVDVAGTPPPAESAAPDAEPVSADTGSRTQIDRVVTVRFIPKGNEIGASEAVLALRAAGMRHGKYGIFHMFPDELSAEPIFSVANLTEPGSFDLSGLAESRIPGMNFFMVLPGTGDPVERFDRMVDTARSLARSLNAELRDERGSSWSIQRERYVREEVIEYRHHLSSPEIQ